MGQPVVLNEPADSVELADVPFFPQKGFYCGPNALATALSRTGIDRTPDSLVDEVYIPGRKGSLQIEMMAATRRLERLAVQLQPSLDEIIAELAAGRPVIVLQNLGLRWLPVWHYAVVIGYDADNNLFTLRSGDEPRRTMDLKAFDRTWLRSGRWAIVILSVGELPSTQDPRNYAEASVALESSGQIALAKQAYETGLRRWPKEKVLLLGRANTAYQLRDHTQAVVGYREILEHYPDYEPAIKNLAHVLDEMETMR